MRYTNIKENHGTFTAELETTVRNIWGDTDVETVYTIISDRGFGYAEGEWFGDGLDTKNPEFAGRIFGEEKRYGTMNHGVYVDVRIMIIDGKYIGVAYKGESPIEFGRLKSDILKHGKEADCCGGFPIID